MNFTGCGNTVNCNNPVVRDFIVDCLRYWVLEMHVDGFRFDLASILGRGMDGRVLKNPPLLESLAYDPVLANTKLIAEAWDAAGLYQVGTLPSWGRWAEWNGIFRDDVRKFVKGDAGMTSALATRLLGSPDLYETSAREPYHSINFVTCHDGFTLNDLVSYNEKHNLANGDNNTDGSNANYSWNCGVEGPTDDPAINELRARQRKNFAAILLFSHGVPMILAGDEIGRTQQGNNNAYCQDNEVSWLDWRMTESHADLLRFFQQMIAFRKRCPLLRRDSFQLHGEGGFHITWHGVKRMQPDWGPRIAHGGDAIDAIARRRFARRRAFHRQRVLRRPRVRTAADRRARVVPVRRHRRWLLRTTSPKRAWSSRSCPRRATWCTPTAWPSSSPSESDPAVEVLQFVLRANLESVPSLRRPDLLEISALGSAAQIEPSPMS